MAGSDADWAWLAGLYEGEGSCCAIYQTAGARLPTIRLSILMTDRDVLERAQSITGHGRLYGPYDRKEGWKPQYIWVITNTEHVREVVARLRPRLCERRTKQIDTMLTERLTAELSLPTEEECFWAKVDRSGEHWIWSGAKASNGRGQFARHGAREVKLAHRYAWELIQGPLRRFSHLRATCDQHLCINPDHWMAGNGR